MKTIIKSAVCSLLGLAAVSCTKFLEENPTTTFAPEAVFSSDKGAWGAVTGSMSAFYPSGGPNGFHNIDQLSSGFCATTQSNVTNHLQFVGMTFPYTHPYLNSAWTNIYTSLNCLNICIENEGNPALSDSVRMKATGTAHFFRAYLLSLLATHWGDVPLPVKSSERNLTRARVFDIYTQILDDLKIAEDNLSPYKGEGNVLLQGMPCLYTVYGFRAQIYVYMACVAQYPGDPFDADGFDPDPAVYWQQAYNNARYVYENGGYDLMQNPVNQVFSYYNKFNTHESLWEITCSTRGGAVFNNSWYLPNNTAAGNYCYSPQDIRTDGTPDPMFMCQAGNSSMPGSIVPDRIWWCQQYLKYNDDHSLPAPQNGNAFPIPKDPRLTYYYITDKWYSNTGTSVNIFPNNGPIGQSNSANAWPYFRKYLDPQTTQANGSSNIIVLRYADVLLTLAEAANELDKSEAEVLGYVNEVLTRARGVGVTDPNFKFTGQPANWQPGDYPTKDDRMQAIMDERMYELGGEFHDFVDFRRRGLAFFQARLKQRNNLLRGTPPEDYFGTTMWGGDPTTGALTNPRNILAPATSSKYPNVEDDDYAVRRAMLWPIPSDELNNNPNITTNNFGY